MRIQIQKKNSTKAERILWEILKKNHIPFKHREKIEGKEIDFIIGKYIIEIDGHKQSTKRNKWLIEKGFIPLHYKNNALYENRDKVEEQIIKKIH